jgi:hypothetical protein
METIAKLNLGNVGQENMPDLLLAGIFPYDFLLIPRAPVWVWPGGFGFLKHGKLELAAAGSQPSRLGTSAPKHSSQFDFRVLIQRARMSVLVTIVATEQVEKSVFLRTINP